MGIGIVLLLWAAIGCILAALAAAAFGAAAFVATKGVNRRRKVVLAAACFPFACVAWAGVVFFLQAVVNETFLHRDPGLGDSWRCPLPNGYAILMIDSTDHGWVYNPKTQPGDGVGEQEDAPFDVRQLQVAGRYILGGIDTKTEQGNSRHEDRSDSYFILDTQTGKRTSLPDPESLRAAAEPLGIQPNLEPISSVYSRYRFTWFEVFAGILLLAPPLIAAILLIRWVLRLRRLRISVPEVCAS